jgi:hypothetical protein
MPGSRGEVVHACLIRTAQRVSFRAELQIECGPSFRFVGRLTSVSSSLLNNAQFLRPDLQYHSIVVLFDSVPTRFCLGTWQTLLSSPLLVMWKSKPLALGPHLIALLNVVSRVLSQVAQAHQ